MTCVIAIKDKDNMYIASDKLSTTESGLKDICKIPKIFKPTENILLGTTGSARFAQVIEYFIDFNIDNNKDELVNLITHIIPSLLKAIEDNRVDESDFSPFIICINNRIFEVDSGLGILEPNIDYTAMGSGGEVAKGSLFSTKDTLHTTEERIKIAMEASSYFIKSVSKEYDIIKKEGI